VVSCFLKDGKGFYLVLMCYKFSIVKQFLDALLSVQKGLIFICVGLLKAKELNLGKRKP